MKKRLTIAELIKHLETLPPETRVEVFTGDRFQPLNINDHNVFQLHGDTLSIGGEVEK